MIKHSNKYLKDFISVDMDLYDRVLKNVRLDQNISMARHQNTGL